MAKIFDLLASSNITNLEQARQNKIAASVNFDELLSKNENDHEFVSDFLDSISNSLSNKFDELTARTTDISGFAFTPQFEATFGLGGPLPNFINVISAKLKLTPGQNRAFQEIAIRNKDITKTSENVKRLAMELKQAGIVYS